jgi:hypothetical protein
MAKYKIILGFAGVLFSDYLIWGYCTGNLVNTIESKQLLFFMTSS